MLERRPASGLAHPAALIGVVEEPAEGGGKPRGVVGRVHEVPWTPSCIRSWNPESGSRRRAAAAHRLEQDHAERRPVARCAEDVSCHEVVGAAAVQSPGEQHVGALRLADLMLVLRPQRAVAHDDQADVAALALEDAMRLDHRPEAVSGVEPPHEDDRLASRL